MRATDEELEAMREAVRAARLGHLRTDAIAQVGAVAIWIVIAVAVGVSDWPVAAKVIACALVALKAIEARGAWRVWKAAQR